MKKTKLCVASPEIFNGGHMLALQGMLEETTLIQFNLSNRQYIFPGAVARKYIEDFHDTANRVTNIVYYRRTLSSIPGNGIDWSHALEKIDVPLSIEQFRELLYYPEDISNDDWSTYVKKIGEIEKRAKVFHPIFLHK